MHVAITGAASGIGAAVVEVLAADGHRITAFDIAQPGGVDTWQMVDIGDMEAVATAAAGVEGPFDALILNAGLPPRDGNAEDVLRVNVFGLRAMAEALDGKLAPGAAIVSTASRAGEHWRENIDEVKALMALDGPEALPDFIAERNIDPLRAYCLSKEFVVVWTAIQTGRLMARGQRANCVSPSAVDTPILEDFKLALGDRADSSLKLIGRAGSPQEIAALIRFLASPESGWIRGQNITVDGGITALTLTDSLGLA
ncbi:SDR family oxidoreductase [Pseudoruegeria sp. HB172150]|uniref:SDR family oxidoreductase n=1 Tax=Pseudoruegeria sp. HB172150 TaxID=2721164 RepID=UPI0015580885|nr:SDR family oxidoreductase [Pseudoruegeria sp. HB172150]